MIVVEHLTKYYGEHLAVDDLSFKMSENHIYGFLGPNGAGKSTTLNIITGCLSATEGSVKIFGHDIYDEPLQAKSLIGYLPEQPPLYLNESVYEYLEFVGRAKGVKKDELSQQIESVMELTGTSKVYNKRISSLSKGYKQRVGIAQALMGNPSIIILDEPTVGLDPIQIVEIRQLIKNLGKDHTVIFSSHILSEVQALCDEILMIAHGKLVAFDTPDNLENSLIYPNEITLTTDDEKAEKLIDNIKSVSKFTKKEIEDNKVQYVISVDTNDIYEISRELFRTFAENKVDILEMSLKKANLEDIFLELSDGNPEENVQSTNDESGENKI